jgi:hypothetical protein
MQIYLSLIYSFDKYPSNNLTQNIVVKQLDSLEVYEMNQVRTSLSQ